MANPRPKFSESTNIALVTQVMRVCPLCDKSLFYTKNGKSHKYYEIAHIYPLNPKPDEIILLATEEKLSSDMNHEANLMALCVGCHTKFDKPRTVDEYRALVGIKKELIKLAQQNLLMTQYEIEEDLKSVIESLYSEDLLPLSDIDFHIKTVDQKLNESINNLTRRKIKNYVAEYYLFVKQRFVEMDANNPDSANLIASQVKTFYLKQKKTCSSQQEIFKNIVAWINSKTKPKTAEAGEILASFFVQNCEVFE
jgi:hypothetical protein